MKNPTSIHSLAQKNCPSGKIWFIHSDGKEHFFVSVINRLTDDRMSYYDGNAPSVNDPLSVVKSIFNRIRAKATVLKVIGDF